MHLSENKKYFFANPRAQYLSMKEEIDIAISSVLDSDSYVLGNQVDQFENEFASFIGQKYTVGVNSGTDALILSLRALGIGQGDEVIIPSFTAVATAAAVVAVGADPVYVDIDLDTYSINPELLESAVSERTKAVILVHLYGHPGKVELIAAWCKTHAYFLIEDCAQAHGATFKDSKVGTFSDIACFSFYPTKNLGGVGDGGGITTNNENLYQRLRMLRQYGWAETRNSQIASQISRLDELQASILRVKLRNLNASNNKRIQLARFYADYLDQNKFVLPEVLPDHKHVFHLYVIRVENRAKFLSELPRANIYPGIHYEWPVHLNDAYASKIGRTSGTLHNTETAAKTVLSLPMYPELSQTDIQHISEVVNNV
jgi:dTDP-4-amino-4,6-dideoxygalactose transaminase